MEKHNRESFAVVDDPFQKGEKLAWCGRSKQTFLFTMAWRGSQGNTFLSPLCRKPLRAMGSKQGVIVTAEKIVSTDFLRAHAGMFVFPATGSWQFVKFPSGAIRAE